MAKRSRSREDEAVYRAVLHLRHLGIAVWRSGAKVHLVGKGVSLDDQALIEYAARRRGRPIQLDLFAAVD